MSAADTRVIVVHNPPRRRRRSKDKPPQMRIVLLGSSVSENSLVGNLILGRAAFDSEAPPDVVERVAGRLKDRRVIIINSPQLLQRNISDHQITQTVRECVFLSDPGPHVFIIIPQYKDFTEEDRYRVEYVLETFSEEAIKHTIVLTTDEETDEGASGKVNEFIQRLTAECAGGHVQFNNETEEGCSIISERLEKILGENHGAFLTCELFYDAEETLLDEDQSRSFASLRTKEADSDGGVSAARQQKLNLILCGSDETLKKSISQLLKQKRRDVELHDRLINLLELPALIGLSEEEVMRQTLRCVSLCHPGVHAFLLIIPDAPLNNEDKAEIEQIHRIFSSIINKHIVILIKQSSERQTEELNEETQSVIERFGGRHQFFGPKTQVSTLMENIEQMLEENRGECFSTEMFLEAQMKKLMKYEEMKKKIHSQETHLLSQGSSENEDDLRIVLLGKTGVGKSATGNTILGREAFTAEESFESVTKESQRQTSEINSRRVSVIDTPGLFDTELSNEEIQREIRHCISMILPGPHVFLLLIPLGRFTKEEETSVKIIQETFGEHSLMYTMVLFTRGDFLKKKTIDQCLGKPGSPLMKLIEACGNRYHVFNNNQTEDRTQVTDLLQKIDNMLKTNGGSYYSCKMFREMEREKQEQQMKILMDRVREREEEMKKLEEEKERMKMMMEEERQNQHKERKRREELKREIREQEKHQKETREEMRRERETFRQEIEDMKKEKEKLQIKYDTEIDRLMNRIENERQNHDKERKRREDAFNEREERCKREMKEKEREMCEEMKREREEREKQKQEEKMRREEEDEKRTEKEQRDCDEFNQRLKEERERIEREKDLLQTKHEEEENKMKIMMEKLNREREEVIKKHEEEKERMKMMMEKLNREREEEMKKHKEEKERMKMMMEKLNREREEEMKKHEEEKERMKMMMEEERQNQDKERKRREEEFNEREEKYKREMKEQEQMRDEMKSVKEEFKNEIKEMKKEIETVKKEKENLQNKYDTETDRLMNRIENERQNHETERKRREKEFNEREEQYKREMKEQEQMRDEMKSEREMLKDEMRQEKETVKKENENLQTETDRLMNRIEKERQNHDKERERREEEFNEREERYKTLMKEKEREMCEEMKREREEWEKQKQEEKMRREEEDEKRREKDKQIQSEMEGIIREKERIERERREQLEDSEKRLREERKMREDQQKTLEEKLRLLEEQHEEELKRRRVECREEYEREEYEREKEQMKRKIRSETDPSLQVTAYGRLETEYRKWSWSLHRAMMETENKLHNLIGNEVINEVEKTDLHRELKKTSEEVETSMSQYFEKDRDKYILIQWKTTFEIKIKELLENTVRETKRRLNEVLQQQDLKKKIDAQRKHHENTLFEKSKELALKLRDKTNDEETLKKEFDLFWEQSMKKIITDTPAIKDIDIMRDVKILLGDIYESVSVDLWRKSTDILSVQSYSDYVQLKKSRGITGAYTNVYRSAKEVFGYFLSKENEAQIRSLVTDVVQQTDTMIQSFNISKMGYNISCIQKLTDYIKARVIEHQEGSVKYVLKIEFFMDLVLSICKRAHRMITDQHRLFRETNDPVLYLEKKRDEYYSIFQKNCHGSASAAMFGQIICQKLKEPIEQSIYKKTAIDLADEVRSNCPSLNGNRSNLEKHILKTLAEEEDFDKYMNYIKTPRDHFKSFIRDEVSRYITDRFSVSVLPRMKENIKLLEQKIMRAAHQSTEHVQLNRGDAGLWLKSFTQQLSDELIFSEKHLSGVNHDDVEDFKLLEDVIRQELPAIMTEISRRFNTNTFPVNLDYKFRPDELLIKYLCQCCWVQCPFCAAVCTNTTENHDGDHSVAFHRVTGVNGHLYGGTTNLCINICTSAVASAQCFYPKGSDEVLYREYRRAGGVYADWSITPDLSELLYWKWFVFRFQKHLDKHYNKTFEGRGEIPAEWRKYSKQDALESLDKYL